MHWDDLRYFIAIAREGSLSAAATTLRVNSSTVFRRLGMLEAQLGTRLFERRGRGYVPTNSAHKLVAYVRRIECEILAIQRELTNQDQGLAGSIRLTTTDTIALRLLSPHLLTFRRLYPELRVELVVDNRLLRLDQGEADVALREGERPSQDCLVTKPLTSLSAAFYASRKYLERCGRPSTYQDIQSHDLISMDATLAHTRYAQFVKKAVPEANVAYRCNTLMAAVSAVENDLGIALLPCFAVAENPEILRLFDPEPSLQATLWLTTHRDVCRTARIRALLAHLSTHLGQLDPVALPARGECAAWPVAPRTAPDSPI